MKFAKIVLTTIILSVAFIGTGFAQTASSSEKNEPVAQEQISLEDKHRKTQELINAMALENARSFRLALKYITDSIRTVSPSTADVLESKIFSRRIIQYIAAVFIMLMTFVVVKYLLDMMFKLLLRFFSYDGKASFVREFLKQIRKPLSTVAWGIGIYIALAFLIKDSASVAVISRATNIIFFAGLFWAVAIVCDALFMATTKKIHNHDSTVNLLSFLRRVIKFMIGLVAILFVLTNCGVNVNTIVASLGIGGMALAFASQETIANFFGSVSIILDRPFIVGDWIKTNLGEGIVETIGFRSTRIRTFSKTIISIPNSILAKEPVENFSKMPVRKVSQILGLTYSTTAEQMKKVIDDLRDVIASIEGVSVDSGITVEFLDFSASSLDITITYFTEKTNYATYVQVKRNVNLAMMETIAKHGLSFAFPSTSVYIESDARNK